MSKLRMSFQRESRLATGLCAVFAVVGFAGVTSNAVAQCPNPAGGDCTVATPGVPGCQNGDCCSTVCAIPGFEYCCDFEWDEFCAEQAAAVCEQPCDGNQVAYSNVTNFNGDGTSSSQGSMITADDIFPENGGLVSEISFSLANFSLAAPHGPTAPLLNGVITIFLINGVDNFTEPVVPDDVFAEIEVDLTGLFDQGDPLGVNEGTVLTLEFAPEDGLLIPPGFFWAGIRPDSVVWQTPLPAGGNGSVNHLGQLLFNPVDVGASDDVFWRQGFGIAFFGGDPVANFGWEFVVSCGPGACCDPTDGSCSIETQEDCEAAGGLFAGSGFTCEDVVCPVVGACCLTGGQCVDDLFEGECEDTFGGTWQGAGTNCPIACPPPCNLTCSGTAEGEACGQSTNDGCNSENQNQFGSISCGGTVCGTAWAEDGTRDTDWYIINVPAVDGSGSTAVTVTLTSEFPADSFILDLAGGCDAIDLPDPENNGVNVDGGCNAGSASYTVCLPVGQYVVFVAPATAAGPLFEGLPCGAANDYRLQVTCGPCEGGGGCAQDCVTSATFAPPPDGVVDAADLAFLLGAWGPGAGCADTVTSATFAPPPDGVVDAADLAALLGAWGNPGCP